LTSNQRFSVCALFLVVSLLAGSRPCSAQGTVALPPLRGVYSPGFGATNSGVMPEPGFTYSNVFLDYSFDQVVCPVCGNVSQKINAALFADVNVLFWVSKKKILGANFALVAGLPFSNSALSLAGVGTIAGGGGFADSFYQPVTLGWHLKRADIMAAYAFFAPTGKFNVGGTDNTGTGHWTNAPAAGETFYLTKNKATAFSAYEMYEFHTRQEGTHILAGETLDVDYSLTQIIPLQKNMQTLLQVGVAGYGQWQMSSNNGPGIDPAHPGHYKVNGIGGAANIVLPVRKASVGVKLMKEFSNSNSVQGYTLQISGAITF
jgi:hypothetical protein